MLRMYIVVHQDTPTGFAAAAIGHAVAVAYKTFKDDPDFVDWDANSFRKVVKTATDAQFAAAKEVDRCCVLTESAWRDGAGAPRETAIVFCPRAAYPRRVQTLPKFGSATDTVAMMGMGL